MLYLMQVESTTKLVRMNISFVKQSCFKFNALSFGRISTSRIHKTSVLHVKVRKTERDDLRFV